MAFLRHKRSVLTVQRGDMKITHKLSDLRIEIRLSEALKQLVQWVLSNITTFF